MIWSDSTSFIPSIYRPPSPNLPSKTVLFCLQAKNNSLASYYDPSNSVSPELAEAMPDVDTVFW